MEKSEAERMQEIAKERQRNIVQKGPADLGPETNRAILDDQPGALTRHIMYEELHRKVFGDVFHFQELNEGHSIRNRAD